MSYCIYYTQKCNKGYNALFILQYVRLRVTWHECLHHRLGTEYKYLNTSFRQETGIVQGTLI